MASAHIPRENSVVLRITKLLRERGAWFVKTSGISLIGCPDLLCCYKGRFIAIEVKRDKNGPYGVTVKQQHELQRIVQRGGTSLLIDRNNIQDLVDALDYIDYDVAS